MESIKNKDTGDTGDSLEDVTIDQARIDNWSDGGIDSDPPDPRCKGSRRGSKDSMVNT